jgi:uncharacterized membrane protein YccC
MTKAAWFRPAIFSVNCYIATILTMYIAFSLDLKSPGWAMTTVYLTSQPISGAMRAKAFYRVIGTFVGGAMMVAIVPNLVNAPELTAAAIILWVTLCLFVALHDRTPRSYMFVLSGYTAALIGFPSVLAPGTVFDTAVSRVEEITVGVLCAALVHGLIFPKSALSAFQAKLTTVLADARRWIADGLTKTATPEVEMERRRIAGDITELYVIATSLRYDTSPVHPDIGIIRAFDRKVVTLLPLLTAIEDRLGVLRGMGPLPDKIARVVQDVHDWVQTAMPSDPSRADELRQACLAATPPIGERNSWADLVTANLTERLAELIDSWQAKLDLAAYLADPSRRPSAEIRALGAQLGEKPLHTDWGIALLSALAATVAMGFCVFFWIVTAWPEGANAVAIAAVACTLFASLDDPTAVLKPLAAMIALCIPIVLVYQFFILPAVTGFELLSLSLAFVLIPAGLLMAIPRYAVVGLALALGFTVELSLQTNYTADFAQIVNSSSAFVVGALAGLITTQVMRVIGVETAARRLLHASYRDLAGIADGSAPMTRDEWASRMLDRVGLLLFRRPRFEARPKHEFADALGDLRLGVNIIETRSMALQVNAERRERMGGMFKRLAAYFRELARGRAAPLGQDLLTEIDATIGEVLDCGSATHACVAAIVGLRRTLYPEAEPYQAAKSSVAAQ